MADYLLKRGLLVGPEQVPDFRRITPDDYRQAYSDQVADFQAVLKAVRENGEAPTYDNTILPFLRALDKLENVTKLAGSHQRAHNTPEMVAMVKEISVNYAGLNTQTMQDGLLHTRFQAVQESATQLSPARRRILEKLEDEFINAGTVRQDGMATDSKTQARIKEIDTTLFEKSADFNATLGASRLSLAVYIEDAAQLEGVDPLQIQKYAQHALDQGHTSGFLIVPDRLQVDTLLSVCKDPQTRERLFKAVNAMGATPPHVTTEIIKEMAELRAERAQLLGFDTYADYVLRNRMITNVTDLNAFEERMAAHLLPQYRKDVEIVADFAAKNGHVGPIQPWDIDYWTAQYKQTTYNMDMKALEPYLHADKTVPGMLNNLGDMYGLRFERGLDIPVPHDDVMAYRVFDQTSGELISIAMMDLYARPGQKSGLTRMEDYRYAEEGATPIMGLQMNLPNTGIIDLANTQTLFHETGHVVHSILSQRQEANMLRGINVQGDFLEMPSQVIENVTRDKAFMSQFLRHHETGAPCPPELLENLNGYMYFGFSQSRLRLIQNSQYDLAMHSTPERRAGTFEEIMKREELSAELTPLVRPYPLTRFDHLWFMPTGYAVGYYSYLWSDVLNSQATAAVQANPQDGQERLIEMMQKGAAEEAGAMFNRLFGPVDETHFLKRIGINVDAPAPKLENQLVPFGM
ncbi:MAG: M3 family metallopeptidase [Pseudomonadota bacterium]